MKNPTFIPINRIPFDNMMPADEFWLPRVLAGRKIYDEYWYSQGQQKVERKRLELWMLTATLTGGQRRLFYVTP